MNIIIFCIIPIPPYKKEPFKEQPFVNQFISIRVLPASVHCAHFCDFHRLFFWKAVYHADVQGVNIF